jgi:hypothetical protein
MKLTIGNMTGGGKPAMATMRELRVGRSVASYSFHTLDLKKYKSTWPLGKDVTKNRITEYINHVYPMRMTSNADMFVPLATLVNNLTGHWWTRQQVDANVTEVTGYRNYGEGDDADEEIGIKLILTRLDTYKRKTRADVWVDNAHLRVSDILWEFNPTNGDGRWYQLYDMPNRKQTRITLPYPTNRLRFRALSNDTNEWVQGIGIYPHVDWQAETNEKVKWPGKPLSPRDGFGYLHWTPASGDVIYVIYTYTTKTHWGDLSKKTWAKMGKETWTSSDFYELGRTKGLAFQVDTTKNPTGQYGGYTVAAMSHDYQRVLSNTVE